MRYDLDDLSQADELRRKRILEEAERFEKIEAAAEAERRAKATARAMETNRRQTIAEYQAAGVEPPNVDENGRPTVSLSLLLSFGWTIEQIGDRNVLVKPERA